MKRKSLCTRLQIATRFCIYVLCIVSSRQIWQIGSGTSLPSLTNVPNVTRCTITMTTDIASTWPCQTKVRWVRPCDVTDARRRSGCTPLFNCASRIPNTVGASRWKRATSGWASLWLTNKLEATYYIRGTCEKIGFNFLFRCRVYAKKKIGESWAYCANDVDIAETCRVCHACNVCIVQTFAFLKKKPGSDVPCWGWPSRKNKYSKSGGLT